MVTVKFIVESKGVESLIYLRFRNGREFDFKRKIPLSIKTKWWNNAKGLARGVSDFDSDKFNLKLQKLRGYILECYQRDFESGRKIDGKWLERTINKHFNRVPDTDLRLFSNLSVAFLDSKRNTKNIVQGISKELSHRTLQQYQNTINKVMSYEATLPSPIMMEDITPNFVDGFVSYLEEVEGLSQNTIGRQIRFLKTISGYGKKCGVRLNESFETIKGWKKKVDFIFLNDKEIQKIIDCDLIDFPKLDNARDWLIVGLFTGQRVSDFMRFSSKSISSGYLEFQQVKTGEKVIMPILAPIRLVLKKYNNHFPKVISDQRFNEYIKQVCHKAGIDNEVEGSKVVKNNETKVSKKVAGTFPKYELVTSHICRRSFATNHYGKISTASLKAITGHTTEGALLTYIGKKPLEYARELENYYNM